MGVLILDSVRDFTLVALTPETEDARLVITGFFRRPEEILQVGYLKDGNIIIL